MQGQTNLYRRGSVYWFSKKVPVDLKAHYASVPSGIFRFSLRTRDRAEAKALATARAAEYDQEFQQVRARLSAPVSPLSPDGLRLLTLAWTSHLLEEDEEGRIEGMSPQDLAKMVGTTEFMAEAYAQAMPRYDTSFIEDEALDFAASYGFHIEPGSPDARRLSVEFLKASQRANQAVGQRNAGQAVDTPQAPAMPLPVAQPGATSSATARGTSGATLESLRDYWQEKRSPAPKSVSKVNTAIRAFLAVHSTTRVSLLTKGHFVAFRDALLEKGSSPATVSGYLSMLRSLLTLARRNDLIAADPTDDVIVEMPKNRKRTRNLEFDASDLQRLFSSPVYAEGWRPNRRKVGEAAFFLPLIALYTGNRLEEAGQLLVSDVVKGPDGWTFDFNNEGDKRTKNESSNRIVPVHPKIIEAGLLDYIKTLDPKGQLFPSLKANKDGTRTSSFSTWFGEYVRERVGLARGKTFHSFRHTYTTAARTVGMAEDVRKSITGHAPGDEGSRYGSVPMSVKRKAQRTIQFPGVGVPKWTATR